MAYLKLWGPRVLLILILAASFVAVLNPEVRSQVRSGLKPDYRIVLSTLEGPVLAQGEKATIVKVKTQDGLFIEIYGETKNGAAPLIQTIALPQKRDAYFTFNGESTNLAVDHLETGKNKTPQSEILVPGLDGDLMATLAIYKYDADTKSFQPVTKN